MSAEKRDAKKPKKKRGFPTRFATMLGASLLLIAALSLINLSPTLSHLDAELVSGPKTGNYHEITERLKQSADSQDGHLGNHVSNGTVDNLAQLIAQKDDCALDFAMVQDGIAPTLGHNLELIARLPKSESVFILGRSASNLARFEDMRGLRVGIGQTGSGTDHLARVILESEDFRPLNLQMQNYELHDQLARIKDGRLDLAVFVLDEDAKLIRNAMRDGLQMASFEHLNIIARQFDFISNGRIGAGQYDPIAVVPPVDRRVLRVDTLVVGNKCASRTETIALLSLLQREFPALLQHNKNYGGNAFFPTASAAHNYMANGGPEWADTHVPWLVDIMPISNWFYVVMAISILFNAMTSTHKFRLWRIDANRERAQQVFRELLGSRLTPPEILLLEPKAKHLETESITKLDEAIDDLDRLRDRCRVQENSAMVPMGQELAYRYQEEQMETTLTAVRVFRRKIDDARVDAGAEPMGLDDSDNA
ncbi:MAG: hypothetical protein GY811_22210 [Myxococcales bacterium]|nr:hypothetical protein [Myxococcales bacterium]